ncbi:hypothetical protein F511_36085 [Dorcoceras hygrometricum]|uniref:Uncharacterized protein n=1 Tax=Dorcoceras hygrometricum TaxID=472368 RepID=A0A2Z7C1G9_9LAMI|nr:hypothetical protein F511_36085 [Dorcoceras hygrometricum]
MTIPVDVPLPFAGMEISKITLGQSIKIPGVDERTWYLASLPKIKPEEKGKKPLQEKDPVKGHPVKEQILLILADIECLVQLREKIIDDVDRFFNSFSFKKLASLKVEDISAKEELVLSWGEAESTRVALNRRMYILTKYRELLIRKFLEATKINFAPGDDLGEPAGEFEESNAIVEAVTTGYESLSPSCDGLTGPDDHGPMVSRLIDRVHFAADCNRPKKDDRYKRDDRRADDRYRKEERYKRDEEDNERNVEKSKDKSKDKYKERSSDRKMKTNNNKRFSRKHDRKVLVAEESTKSWADSDSDSSSSSSSSSDSEQEEVHCFMADQTDEDEVFDISNVIFTRDDLVIALNDMVKEYRKLSHSFEEAKAENMSLKSSSAESSSDELEDVDILKTELSKLQAENEKLRNEISELKAEVNKSTVEMSSWNKANLSLQKLYESQKQASDKTGIGFNNSVILNHLLLAMAASFYSNSVHVDFDSVLALDEPGMVSMFQALVASGLQGFLGCSPVVYEEALVEFFANGRVRDGLVVSSVDGVIVEISEELFAETFELPVDGLGDLSEMPKDAIFYARSIVSLSGEPISLSGRKNQMKFEYRLPCDIMAKAISVKAGSFNAITVEKFSLMTAVVCSIRMN